MIQKTELDDLVVLSWKLIDLGSDKFEEYTRTIEIKKDQLDNPFYVLKTCERIVVAFLCSTKDEISNTPLCSFCSSLKSCYGKEIIQFPSGLMADSKIYTGIDAFRYLALVASSLDSSTIGEPEILGQFKRAFVSQQEAHTLTGSLNDIIVYAYKAGKKVHTSSDIPKGRLSILSNAEKIFSDWIHSSKGLNEKEVSIAIVGTGKMGKDAYKYFQNKYDSIKVFSRNRTEFLGQDSVPIFEPYHFFQDKLNNKEFDVLILCSSTNKPFITSSVLENQSNLLIFDVGIPKNADPSIQTLPGITLYQMDQLVKLSETNYAKREQSLIRAHEIIEEQVAYVSQVFEKKMINPFIKDLRIDLESVAKRRLEDYALKKDLPVEFYKWFNNTIKEMMHVSQQHLEKGLSETNKTNSISNELVLKDFQLVSTFKPINGHKIL